MLQFPGALPMHYYFFKLFVVLAVVINLQEKFSLPIPRWTNRMLVWLLVLVEFFETYGWTLIVAILAAVWQIAERH